MRNDFQEWGALKHLNAQPPIELRHVADVQYPIVYAPVFAPKYFGLLAPNLLTWSPYTLASGFGKVYRAPEFKLSMNPGYLFAGHVYFSAISGMFDLHVYESFRSVFPTGNRLQYEVQLRWDLSNPYTLEMKRLLKTGQLQVSGVTSDYENRWRPQHLYNVEEHRGMLENTPVAFEHLYFPNISNITSYIVGSVFEVQVNPMDLLHY